LIRDGDPRGIENTTSRRRRYCGRDEPLGRLTKSIVKLFTIPRKMIDDFPEIVNVRCNPTLIKFLRFSQTFCKLKINQQNKFYTCSSISMF